LRSRNSVVCAVIALLVDLDRAYSSWTAALVLPQPSNPVCSYAAVARIYRRMAESDGSRTERRGSHVGTPIGCGRGAWRPVILIGLLLSPLVLPALLAALLPDNLL
jgi:hypothetical protein